MAARLEDLANRRTESGLGRPLSGHSNEPIRRHSGARAKRKLTRSICRVVSEPGIHNHERGLWIPGPRQGARPGMTDEFWARFIPRSKSKRGQVRDMTRIRDLH